jgi:ferredoxin
MSDRCMVSFPETEYPPLALAVHQNLSEHLTIQNSPVLFGCRTGICGTCLVEVEGDSPPPMPDEQEMLDTLAPQQAKVRLACQLVLTADLEIRRLSQ